MADVQPDLRRHPLQRKTPPWRATLVAQVFLCIGLYAAFKVGAPQAALRKGGGFGSGHGLSRGANDIHFLSVAGGSRSINQQMQLLRMMNTAARIYNVKFVVCLAGSGDNEDNDALLSNTTLIFEALRVPWIATEVSPKQDKGYFLKQFKISDGKMLDVIVLDTRLWKVDSEATIGDQQLNWLTRALLSSNGIWRVVVGLHLLTDCDDHQTTSGNRSIYSRLSGLLLQHGVDLYIGKQRCPTTSGYILGVPYISNPSNLEFRASSRKRSNGTDRRLVDGFHLHRVSPLEIETYFINLAGDVASIQSVHHLGREDI